MTLYFSLETERLAALVAAGVARGESCAVGVSAGQGAPGVECVFLPLATEFDDAMRKAHSLGATVRLSSFAAEARRRETPTHVVAHRFAPQTPAEFVGAWYARLEQHVRTWVPTNGRGALVLLHGPTGTGKTCAVELLGARIVPVAVEEESCWWTAARTIAEHCRTASTLAVAHLDDLHQVDKTPAALAGLTELAALAAKYPRKVALVAAADSLYSGPLMRDLRTKTLPFDVVPIKIDALKPYEIAGRIKACFPRLTAQRVTEIGTQAGGSMWSALHLAEFGSTGQVDLNDMRAPCDRLQSFVGTISRGVCAGEKGLFEQIDRQADLDYGAEWIMANYGALTRPLPPVRDTAGRDVLGRAEHLARMEGLAECADLISLADCYEFDQRSTGYAGGDGVDTDKRMVTALGITGPCIALGIAAGGRGLGRDKAYRTKTYDAMQVLQTNCETLLSVRYQLDVLASRADGKLVLSADAEWYRPERQRRACLFSIDTVERVAAYGQRGLEFCREVGLVKEDALRVVGFARELTDRTSATKLEAEYKALQKAKPAAFVPRISAAGTATRVKAPPKAKLTQAKLAFKKI